MTALSTDALNVQDYIDRYLIHPDCHWDAMGFNFGHLNYAVRRFHFCAATNDNNDSDDETGLAARREPVNHWMIFLQTSHHSSVRLSISSGETADDPALIEVISKEYTMSHFSPASVSSDVVGRVTVEAVLRLLILRGRDRYRFTPTHVGCRWWTCCIACDFEAVGWVREGFAQQVTDAASLYYSFPKSQQHHAPTIGVYTRIEQGKFF
ncbi:hypothetical protein CYLTODRAFT_422074 [Cylindrobasidium torrendii FP15055 ss-10]|uniref:DUF7770 domain-containing protein n=1 Tax=Cylindrobasidium torrendii FP15055 ss-10 TaxID=1314674 RepID=A0A0D7BCQ1_9AGAR|nr:hypothetical protein CYLTODRAFT_422074 [Cylindrobasidium torrendii FP15055 ss-10]